MENVSRYGTTIVAPPQKGGGVREHHDRLIGASLLVHSGIPPYSDRLTSGPLLLYTPKTRVQDKRG